MLHSTFVSLFVYRLMSSVGELYYLLLIPLLFLYVAIFLSNKLQSHQQQRQQQQRDTTHSGSVARRRQSAAPAVITELSSSRLSRAASGSSSLERTSPSSSLSSPSPLHSRSLSLPPSPTPSPSGQLHAADLTREEEETLPLPSSEADASPSLTLRFLLPDYTIVRHSFPCDPSLEVSAVLSALYPAESPLLAASRLIYQGRVMRADTALADYDLSDDDIVHVHHITLPASAPAATALLPSSAQLAAQAASPPPPLLLMLSVMAALLGAGWGAYWSVGERLFDVASTLLLLCLSSLTAAGVLLAFALQRPLPRAAVEA